MKKETTFLKLFTLLVLSCLSIGYVWADKHEIKFDRCKKGSECGYDDEIPMSKEKKVKLTTVFGTSYYDAPLNCTDNPVPNGTDWTPSGSSFTNSRGSSWIGSDWEHYWGYGTEGQNFTIKFTNFKYYVTKISLYGDDANTEELEMGLFTKASFDGTKIVSTRIYNPSCETSDVLKSKELKDETIYNGLDYVQYKQTSSQYWTYFAQSNFLWITYQDPTISIGKKYLALGKTYTIQANDITWTYQGAFSKDDIVFSTTNTDIVTINGSTITAKGTGEATITATIVNGTNTNVASTTFTVVVDETKNISTANNITTVSGTWTGTDLNTALRTNTTTSTSTVDLTEATISDAPITVSTTNPNTLIKASSTNQVSNTTNVLTQNSNGELVCNKLKLTDGSRFSANEAFVANATEYSRSTAATWGTICLPYAPPTDNATYYELTSANDDGSLTFSKVTTPKANTPYLYKNNTENQCYNASYTEDVNVEKTPTSFATMAQGVYTMHGVFNPLSVIDGKSTTYTTAKSSNHDLITNANAYYYGTNQFMKVNGRFNLAGFRAYLTSSESTNASASSAKLSVNYDDDDISTSLKFIENKEDGTVKVVFDTNGRRLNAPQKGINIINGKKILVK